MQNVSHENEFDLHKMKPGGRGLFHIKTHFDIGAEDNLEMSYYFESDNDPTLIDLQKKFQVISVF